MAFEEQLPEWEAEGTQPPKTKRVEGWQPTEKPPAAWFNWLFNRTYKVLRELQQKAAEKEDVQLALQTAQQAEQTANQAASDLASHLNDNVRHVTQEEKISWNNKVSKSGDTMTGDLRIESVYPQLVFTYTDSWGDGIRGRIVAKNNVKEVWSIGDPSDTGDLYIKNLVNSPIRLVSGYLVVTNSVTNNFFHLLAGNGSPEGNVTAPYGSLYVRTDAGNGARLWVKDTPGGNTGWKAVQTS